MRETGRRSDAGAWMGKSAELAKSVCSQKTKIILIGKSRRYQNGLKEPEYGFYVK